MSRVKIFCYEFLFVFITNHITNSQLLLVLDLLQLFTLPCLYLNPIYTHLATQPIFNFYFTEIHPRLYFFKQQTLTSFFPICSTIFTVSIIILIIFRKHKTNFCITGAQLLLVLLPLLIFRLSSEMVNVFNASLPVQAIGLIIVIVNLMTICVILVQYQKIAKILDLLIGILLFCNINQYALMSFLAIKIILTYLIPISTPTKFIKLTLQSSLLISSFLLIFVKPVTINYIMLASLIGITFLYPTFNFIVGLQYTDITRIKPEEDDVYCLNQCYSFNELEFFKKINRHIPNCVDLCCKCREVMKINSLKDLKKWIPSYAKTMLKIAAEGTDLELRKNDDKQLYQKQIQYIKYCVESSEELDFQGFLRLHKLTPKNSIQQYQKYHYLKKYSLVLQKSNPKALKMNLVNHNQQNSPYDDMLNLQNKISAIIKKIQIFWNQLLKLKAQKSHQFVTLIEEISNQINSINKIYEDIELNYDQKQQAEYYYNIFRLLALQQKPSGSIFLQHQSNYVLVSCGNKITNITTNFTHLVQKTRNQLLDHSFASLMLPVYVNDHSEWMRNYVEGYKISEQAQLIKTVAMTPNTFKVVQMTHMLIPNFKWLQTEKDDDGINVVTLISLKYKEMQEQIAFTKEIAFHLMVCRQTLDIIAYEPTIFDYFNEKETVDNTSKLLRTNLKKLFPNLNREAIINNTTGKVLIAKQDKDFFSAEQENGNMVDRNLDVEITQNPQLSRIKNLQISEVPSAKNKQLNMLLLSFQYLIEKDQKNKIVKNSQQDLKRQNLNHKTLKNIIQETSKNQNKNQKNPEQDLRKLEVLQCLSILLIFGVLATVFALFQIEHTKIKDFLFHYDKKAQFYTDLSLTQLYFQNFHAGKNRYNQMQSYWSYNEQYPDILATFNSISEQTFSKKFSQYVHLFQNRLAFQELTDKISNLSSKYKNIIELTTIMFWCCFIFIVINFVVSLTIFIKNQVRSIDILSTFLYFKEKKIQNNLNKLEILEKIFQIQQFKKNVEKLIQVEEKQSEVIIVPDDTYDEKSQKKKRRLSFSSNKQKLQRALKNHFNSYLKTETGNSSTKDIVKKDQLNLAKLKRQKEQKKSQQPQIDDNNAVFSLFNRIYKNKRYFTPTIIGLILKISMSLTLLLFITNLMKSTTKCLQFKHQLFYQPVQAMSELQIQYFGGNNQKISLIEYQFNNRQKLKQLPLEFQAFRNYSAGLESPMNPLCGFIDQTKNYQLFEQCQNCQADIFVSGIHILIEFIEQKFRQTRIGYLPKSFLLEQNNLSLAIQVCLQIFSERNRVYMVELYKFYEKYSNIKNLLRIVLISVFLICLYLQVKQFSFAEKRKNETKNLFMIVPAFMKNQNPTHS